MQHNTVKKSVQLLLSCATLLCFLVVGANADEISDLVRDGNIAFQANDLSAALAMYKEAESQIPKSPELTYNIASVLHEQGKYEEAVDLFKGALNSIGEATEASAHYNLGNSYFRSGDYVKAIESYQNALGLNPDDMDAKFNLELSRKMLKENSKPEQSEDQQQQQQEKNEQEQKQKDDENKNENEDEQNKEGQNQQENQSQDEQQKQKQEQQQGEDDKKMSREDAARILNALRDDEQKQQEKSRRARVQISDPNGEDW